MGVFHGSIESPPPMGFLDGKPYHAGEIVCITAHDQWFCKNGVLATVLTHECEGARGAGFWIIPENFFVAWLPIDTISVFW